MTSIFMNTTVRAKLMRVVLLTNALALLVSGAAMIGHELYIYRTTWAADLAAEAAILATSTAPALAFDDHAAAERSVNAFEGRRRITLAALYSSDGRLFALFRRGGESAPPPAPPPEGMTTRGGEIELVEPVRRSGEFLGSIYLRSRYDVVGRLETYLGIFALATLLSMSVAFIISQRMQKGITDPLDAIVAVAQAVVSGRDYSLRATKLSDDEVGVVVDAFNKMLEEVQARTRELGDADRRKDEFLATLAHELRNPLAPIRHAVKLLESAAVDERQRQWAREVISRQVQRMALLLDDLLDVSRITRGRLDLKLEVVGLDTLVRAAVETARPLIEARKHRLCIEVPRQPVSLSVDPLRMSQSLSNLLTNAAKYTDSQGTITLAVRLSASELTLAVADNGIGIEPRLLPGIFEMFSQVDSAITRSEGGLGIGLALVKGLVALHGGTIEGRSAGLGQGSEFVIHLPRSMVIEAGESVPLPASARTGANAAVRVLVADDNRDAADSLAMLLELNGHEVSVVHSGGAVLAHLEQQPSQVLILDIGMPDLSGYDVAQRVRAAERGTRVLLIAVTGWGQAGDKARALAAGFDHHLTKPIDPDRLEQLIQEHLRAGRGVAAPAE